MVYKSIIMPILIYSNFKSDNIKFKLPNENLLYSKFVKRRQQA